MLSGSEYRPSLRLLGGPSVLYVNSFTKKVWPRCGWATWWRRRRWCPRWSPPSDCPPLGSPPLGEAAMAEFLQRGYYDTHLARLQAELDRRYEACLETLRALMPEEVRWTTPGGGPTLWLDLPRRIDLGVLGARPRRARG
jgi:DNA-binding transcriptional MocR family regulator